MSSGELQFTGRRRNRIILAASAGNFAEWYDWGVYGVVATVIATKFFPEQDPTVGLLSTYAVFALSYLSRPLGGVAFGWIGDRVGRRRALSLTIIVTCAATGLMGVLPTYAQIGLFAPVLLLLVRLVQSMGTGGEFASAISFVFEHSPVRRKARNVSMLIATTFLGIMIGSVVARIFSAFMSESAYETYGWRLLFLFAIPLGILGVYLRSRVEETPEFKQMQAARQQQPRKASPLRETLRFQWRVILVFIVCVSSYALISTTVTSYFTTFLTEVNGLSKSDAYTTTIVSNVALIAATLLAGLYGDRLGLRRSMMLGGGVVAVFAVPGLVVASNGLAGGVTGAIVLGACKGLLAAPALLAVSQIFPTAVRVTAGALAYNVTQALFGGTGPIIGVWLNHSTGGPYGFGIYLAVLGLVTVAVALRSTRYLGRAGYAGQSASSEDTHRPGDRLPEPSPTDG